MFFNLTMLEAKVMFTKRASTETNTWTSTTCVEFIIVKTILFWGKKLLRFIIQKPRRVPALLLKFFEARGSELTMRRANQASYV